MIALFALFAAGCGSGGHRTCDKPVGSSDHVCQETSTNASNFLIEAYDDECVTEGGTAGDACPTGAVGKCSVTQSGNGFTTTLSDYFYSGTAAARMQACQQGLGTWTSL